MKHVARCKYRTQKIAICAPSHNFVGLLSSQLKHVSTIGQNLLNSKISPIYLYNMVNFGQLTVEICWRVLGTPANFNRFRVMASLLHRRRSPEVNKTLQDIWPSPGLVHYVYILPPNGILPAAKFTLRPSLAFSCIGSVTARHSSSGRQSNFVAWYKEYKEWNYGTFVEVATYIRLGGHHVGHRPTI